MKNRLTQKLFILLCLVSLLSCSYKLSQEEIDNADYGPIPPSNYEDLIKKEISIRILNPMSAVYEFSQPSKGFTRRSRKYNSEERFGWKVCGKVTFKNRMGRYVGKVPFYILFQDKKIVTTIMGKLSDNKGGTILVNSDIYNACGK